MLVDPRVIRGHVVRDEIEHQLQSALLHPYSQSRECRVVAQIAVYGVALDGEPRAGDIFVLEVWQRFRERATPFGIGSRDRLRRRAGLPDAQEPNPVKSHLSDAIQFVVGNVIQGRRSAETAR